MVSSLVLASPALLCATSSRMIRSEVLDLTFVFASLYPSYHFHRHHRCRRWLSINLDSVIKLVLERTQALIKCYFDGFILAWLSVMLFHYLVVLPLAVWLLCLRLSSIVIFIEFYVIASHFADHRALVARDLCKDFEKLQLLDVSTRNNLDVVNRELVTAIIFFNGIKEVNVGNILMFSSIVYMIIKCLISLKLGIPLRQILTYLVRQNNIASSLEIYLKVRRNKLSDFAVIAKKRVCFILVFLKWFPIKCRKIHVKIFAKLFMFQEMRNT
ncbi:hypothetical protein IEQ34_000601 [Dendrobium chrysotoxum]|uniref:DUF7138 domain-containing protein n=1 Tax=Dendrobium chrysotoxum TaxID=161865 RepID=A0AAV7HSM5_DENCH|nr:hypothetical protein IEQ34_000601 [Dendrobium chrysotoxum]